MELLRARGRGERLEEPRRSPTSRTRCADQSASDLFRESRDRRARSLQGTTRDLVGMMAVFKDPATGCGEFGL